jgi:hypothetical protein
LTDNAQSGTQSVALAGTGSGSDFTIAVVNETVVVERNGSATYSLLISPVGGSFPGVVNFACDGLPAFATCSVNPQFVIPGIESSTIGVVVRTAGTRKIGHPVFPSTTSPGVYRFSLVASSEALQHVTELELIVPEWWRDGRFH